jgi:hypothetical protein
LALIERWNGTGWAIEGTPRPFATTGIDLNGVSCPSVTACTVVGDFRNSAGVTVTLAEGWNGTSWAIQTTPNAPNRPYSSLAGVSCAAATACTAVGAGLNPSNGNSSSLAEAWNGTQWALESTPMPPHTRSSSFSAVSCLTGTTCVAVGSFTDGTGTHLIADQWNGTSWAIQILPTPAGATSMQLTGVSCPSSTACTAVGFYQNGSGNDSTFAEGWNATSWAIQTTQGSGDQNSSLLLSVSCTTSTDCTAVGRAFDPGTELLAERWDGTSWVRQTPTVPAGASNLNLDGVSCTTATACVAVGSYVNSASQGQTLAETWNGATWVVQTTPNPTGATFPVLGSISCTTSSACTAVGPAFGAKHPGLAERYTG